MAKTKKITKIDLAIWEGTPVQYRHCMSRGIHSLEKTSEGEDNQLVIQWWACELCPVQRLTTINPLGEMEHTYARPDDYKLPEGLTYEDRRLWLRYEAENDIKTAKLPKPDPLMIEFTFGQIKYREW